MDHQLQQLARLGLELERFDLRVHCIPFWRRHVGLLTDQAGSP
jgi:hypothetical protein